MNADYYRKHLKMMSHPEGGSYFEVYRNPLQIEAEGFDGPRSMATSIFFLLEQGEVSALHRIKSDEIWYHHDGGCLEIIEIDESGREIITRLGRKIDQGEVLQHVVKAGRWFGSKPASGSDYCLVGCQVSPGFDFRDFELMDKG
jgi:predicted cupin superfamily sugar epimerase